MKNFFEFNKPKDTSHFYIKEPDLPFAKTIDKDETISDNLSKNIEIL